MTCVICSCVVTWSGVCDVTRRCRQHSTAMHTNDRSISRCVKQESQRSWRSNRRSSRNGRNVRNTRCSTLLVDATCVPCRLRPIPEFTDTTDTDTLDVHRCRYHVPIPLRWTVGCGGCSCQMRQFSLYRETRLCSAVDVASFPASSEQPTNSICCRYKGVTADWYRFWYRLQYWRYRYQTDTTGIGPIPIPSTGIGLSLVPCIHELYLKIVRQVCALCTHCAIYYMCYCRSI